MKRCGLNGFSLIFSEVGVEPKHSDELFGVICCDVKPTGGGVLSIMLPKRAGGMLLVMRIC